MYAKELIKAFVPNRTVSGKAVGTLAAMWVALVLSWWTFFTSATVPKPVEILSALGDLWSQGEIVENLVQSLWLNVEAIFWSTLISLGLAVLTVLPGAKPLATLISKLRFLPLVGFTYIFGLSLQGHSLKLWLLVFGMTVFYATSMMAVVADIPRERYDHARTLRMGPWRTVWEVVIRGTADQAFEVLRQNAAIGWMMLTMVEGLVRAEGGIGLLLTNQNRFLRVEMVFAVQLLILTIGLLQDYGIGFLRNLLFPYADLGKESGKKAEKKKAKSTIVAEAVPDAVLAQVEHVVEEPFGPSEYTLGTSLLQVDNVSLALGGNDILKGVNATVYNVIRPNLTQGQVVGFLGPSGIGKTQLFRILAGLNTPDEGAVYMNEVNAKGEESMVPVEPGKVGVVSQHYTLFMHRTVLDNLEVAGRMSGLKQKEVAAKAKGLLERFSLADKADQYPAELSGGQRQRIAIAQQLMCSNGLLLMDEPFSGLDPIMKEVACELISEVAAMDERMTIVVITHDIGAAMQVSDTLWLMGRDRDAEGKTIPGARIKETVDLMVEGLTWRPGVSMTKKFAEVRRNVRNKFFAL